MHNLGVKENPVNVLVSGSKVTGYPKGLTRMCSSLYTASGFHAGHRFEPGKGNIQVFSYFERAAEYRLLSGC